MINEKSIADRLLPWIAVGLPVLGLLGASYVAYAKYVEVKSFAEDQKLSSGSWHQLAEKRHEENAQYKLEMEHRMTVVETLTDCLTGVRACGR